MAKAKRAGFPPILCLAMLFFLQNNGCASCSGVPSNFHPVALTPNTTQTILQGGTVSMIAAVSNDSSGAGVNWSLSPSSGAGSLTGVTTTAATYNAPAVVASETIVTVTATSVSFPGQSASLQIKVEPPPSITTTTLPAGNFGSPYSATVNATGGVPPFTWSISAGSLTTGLSLGASTTNSVGIAGTPGAQVDSNFTIKVTDSTGAFATQALTISIGAPLPLVVTTTTLPSGVLGVSYPSPILQASGGVPPFTWVLAPASTPLPTGLSLAANGTISGMPTAAGTFDFTVQVTDTQATTATKSLSITINDLRPLTGHYAFEFSGFNSNGAVVIAGNFVADGLGNITGGVEDFNTIVPLPQNQMLRTFTGTYTLGADNRGQLVFSSLAGTPTYDFAIDKKGLHGRMVEFDATGVRGSGQLEQQNTFTCTSSTLPGTDGTDFVIGVSGVAGSFSGISPGPVAMVGRLTAEPTTSGTPGTIDNGQIDANVPGFNLSSNPMTLAGTFQTTTQAARCTMSISPSALSGVTYSVYPISSTNGKLTEAFVVETDTVSQTTPYVTVGKLIQQVGYPFTVANNSFAGPSVASLSGNAIPNGQIAYLPFVSVAELSPAGGGAFTMPLSYNFGGSVVRFQGGAAIAATLNTGNSFGRVDTNLVAPIDPVFYVINTDEAFCILENVNAAVLGVFEPQSKGEDANKQPFTTFTADRVAGTFATGTSGPATNAAPDFSGTTTLDGVSVVGGTQDTSTTLANTAGQTVTGTYALSATGATDGSGTVTLSAPAAFTGDFFIVSPTKIVMISTTVATPADTNPVLIYLGDCVSTCGEN